MSDRKKVILLIGVVILSYFFIYVLPDVGSFIESNKFSFPKPDFSLKSNNESDSNERIVVKVVEEQSAVIDIVKKTSTAVVSVLQKDIVFDYQKGPIQTENSIGTGFVVDGKEGYVLTNKHVVSDKTTSYVVVFGQNESKYDVVNISLDPSNDFAILKIDLMGKTVPQLDLGNSADVQVGQTVIAIGNSLGEFGNSVTKGIISGIGRGIVAQEGLFGSAEYLENVIQTDAALNPGNSGGPLLDIEGRVIGINVAISQGAENIGFSLPIDSLKPAINMFKEKGKITRPFLGVEYRQITKEISEASRKPVGAFVQRVLKDSPADKAGIQVGDIIMYINNIRLDDEENTLSKLIKSQQTENDISIVVDRGGREIKTNVNLEDSTE